MSGKSSEQSISEVEYDGRKYSLVVIPGLNTKIVVDKTQEIKGKLHLDSLADDFRSLGLLLRLAHCGVAGHVDLEIKVRRALYNAVTICDDTVHTVNEFERASTIALENMQTAYQYLEEDLEEDAIENLQEVIITAQKMQEAANELSQKCKQESDNLLEVQEATVVKKGEVDHQIKEANINLSEQESHHKTQKELMAEEEEATIKNKAEIETAVKNKSDVFKTKDEYVEEEQNKMVEISLEKQRKVQQLQLELEQKLNQIRSSLKETLKHNENIYQDSLLKNDDLMKNVLQENLETLKRQQKTIVDDRQKSENANKIEYEEMLQSKSEEVENQMKLEEGEFALKYDKSYQQKLKIIEKEYEEKVSLYKSQCTKQIKDNQSHLEKLNHGFQEEFDSKKYFYEQEQKKQETETKTFYNSERQNINVKYGTTTELSEKDLQEAKEKCSQQISDNEAQYNKDMQKIEKNFSANEQKFKKDFDDLKAALDLEENEEYKKLQELIDTPIVFPSEASPGVFKKLKSALVGNAKDVNDRDTQTAEAESMKSKVQLTKEEYERNKSRRTNAIEKAREDWKNNQSFNKEEKARKIKEAQKQKTDRNNSAISEKDSKIQAAKNQKDSYDERMKLLSSTNEEQSKAINSVMSKFTEDINNAKSKQIEAKNDAERLMQTKNEDARKERDDKCREALVTKEHAIRMLQSVTTEAKTATLKLKAQNEAKVLVSQANEKVRIKWESENRDIEQKKAEADAKAYADKTKSDEKSLAVKKKNDKEAVEKADKDEFKLKSEYEMKLKELEQETQSKEMKTMEYYKKKYEDIEKQAKDIKELEEHYRKQQLEHEKQRKIAKIKMAEAAQKIASFQNEVEVNKSSQYCLNEAVTALRQIQGVMINTANFWRDTEAVCKNVTENHFTKKVKGINDRTESSRKILWKSSTFKKEALAYYGKWVALRHVCVNAGKQLSFAQEDIHKYLQENLSPEEAKHHIREIADKLKNHLAIKDKPVHKK